jgi:hypothetical protein
VNTTCQWRIACSAQLFLIEQFPHFRFGAKLAVSPRVVRVFDALHSEPSNSSSLLNRLAATARERLMNGAVLIATEFHNSSRMGFQGKGIVFDLRVPANRSHPFDPLGDSVVP